MKQAIATICLGGVKGTTPFLKKGLYQPRADLLIRSALKFTPFDIVMVTNDVEYFSEYSSNPRVHMYDMKDFDDKEKVWGVFNYNLKRLPIKVAQDMGYDIIYHNDCDCFYHGWDDESFKQLLSADYDTYYVNYNYQHTIGGLATDNERYRNKIDALKEFIHGDILQAYPPLETRILFKNNDKLTTMLDFWDKLSKFESERDMNPFQECVIMGAAARYAKMNITGVSIDLEFTKYCKLIHSIDFPVRILTYNNHTEKTIDSIENIMKTYNI